MLPIRPEPASRVSEVPGTVSRGRMPSGPRIRRSHQPWTSSRCSSIVLLKISAVSANRNRRRIVSRMFVATTSASTPPPGSGPPTSATIAGT